MKRHLTASALLLVCGAITWVFLIDFCNLVYRCGCRSLWAGADTHCNIHTPGARHCPWCVIGETGFLAVAAVIILVQGAVAFRTRWSPARRAILALLAFPLIGSLEALLLGWWFGYWN